MAATRIKYPSLEAYIREVAASVERAAPAFGLEVDPTRAFSVAHSMISTGAARSAAGKAPWKVWDWNFWGMKVGSKRIFLVDSDVPGWHGRSANLRTRERDEHDAAHAERADFRLYDSPTDAAADHLRWITGMRRYAPSEAKLRAGDLGYMVQLGSDGWYTGGTATRARLDRAWRRNLERVGAVLEQPGTREPGPVASGGPDGRGLLALAWVLFGTAVAAA